MCWPLTRNHQRTATGIAANAYSQHTPQSRAADLFRKLAAYSPALAKHSIRVAGFCSLIAARIELPTAETHLLIMAARLHDVGKTLLPGDLLDKPGRLSPGEWERIKDHPVSGQQLALDAQVPVEACAAIRHHHERWDGSGYPDGLKGEQIPFLAQILTVADSFVTITEDRPYQAGQSMAKAWNELLRCRGTQFSPAVVDGWLSDHAPLTRFSHTHRVHDSRHTNEEAPFPRHADHQGDLRSRHDSVTR